MKRFLRFARPILVIILALCMIRIQKGSISNASNSDLDLERKTKIYSHEQSEYYDGCESNVNYINVQPSITVLTHGCGSDASSFSNDGNDNFDYNPASIIERIFQLCNGEAVLYYAKFKEHNSYKLYRLNRYSYNITDETLTEYLLDYDKHIILVFDASDTFGSNDYVYSEFNYLLDTISYQYKSYVGKLPLFNLIGHSRGGLTNIMYASKHPFNVKNIASVGTPYNGSKLGKIDKLVIAAGFEETVKESEGFQDILNVNKALAIRNDWNAAYTINPSINALAYGSMTSISLVNLLINELDNNDEYVSKYSDYKDILNSIINIMETEPTLTGIALTFVDGFASILNSLGYNLYDSLLQLINPNLSGTASYNNVSEIIKLINVINDEIVIMDDLFIDLNSQLGLGFSDNISFNGFLKKVKVFGASDVTMNRAFNDKPCITHNLETLNTELVNSVTNSMSYSWATNTIESIDDGLATTFVLNNQKILKYDAVYGGNREIKAPNAEITVYKKIGNKLVTEATAPNTLTHFFKNDTSYYILLDAVSSGNVSFKIEVSDEFVIGNNPFQINGRERRVFLLKEMPVGYYNIELVSAVLTSTNECGGIVDGAVYVSHCNYTTFFDNKRYVYFESDNATNYNVNFKLIRVGFLSLNDEIEITSNTTLEFQNTNPNFMSFAFQMNWLAGTGDFDIYDNSHDKIGTYFTDSNGRKAAIPLLFGERCYIKFKDVVGKVTVKLTPDLDNYCWRLGSEDIKTGYVKLEVNKQYSLQLVKYINGVYVNIEPKYKMVLFPSTVTYNGIILSIGENTPVGKEMQLEHKDIPNVPLIIYTIENLNGFFSIINSEEISIKAKREHFRMIISMKIETGGNVYNVEKRFDDDKISITEYISKTIGTSTITIEKVIINDITYGEGYKPLPNIVLTVDNLFLGGSGTEKNPFQISCFRHFNNMRYAQREERVGYEESHMCIADKFILLNDITSPTNEVFVPFYEYRGTLFANSKKTITINRLAPYKSQQRLGLILIMGGGSIENIALNIVSEEPQTINRPPVKGAFCGYMIGGEIKNCEVYGRLHQYDKNINGHYGGIVGMLSDGTIEGCISYIEIESYGTMGGIAGMAFAGNILNCTVKASMRLNYDNSLNQSEILNIGVGGIIGDAYGSVTINGCTVSSLTNSYLIKYVGGININNQFKPCIGWSCGRINTTNQKVIGFNNIDENVDIYDIIIIDSLNESQREYAYYGEYGKMYIFSVNND